MILKNKSLHIAIVCSGLNKAGGLERMVVQLSNKLCEVGYLISLLIISNNKESFYQVNKDIRIKTFQADFGITNKQGYILRKVGLIKDILKLKNSIDTIKPDILITTEYHFTVSSVLAGLFQRYKIISWQHSSFKQKKSTLWQLFTNFAYKRVHYIVCLTKDDEDIYRKYNSCTVTIPNFTFVTFTNSDLTSNQILTIARLTNNKGIDLLMNTAKIVFINHKNWIWKVIGNGEFKAKLIQFIRDNQLENNLILQTPFTSELEKEYTNSSIYVMTSRIEPFGMVLIEAMNHGLPCVAFDCENGPRHIISDKEDGILVEIENPLKLAEAISFLIENEAVRKEMGMKALRNVERFYSKSIIPQWENLFKKLTSN